MRTSRERARKSGDSLSTKARGEAPEADRLPGLPGPTVGARARARARALSVEAKRSFLTFNNETKQNFTLFKNRFYTCIT